MEKKKWFDIWPYYLPFTIDYPEMDIWEMLESPSRLYRNKDALIYYGNRIKYRELWQNVKNLSTYIKMMGFGKGDRIGIMMQNSPQFIISFFAISRSGATIVLMSPALDMETAEYIATDTNLKMVITTAELLKVPWELHEKFNIPVICGLLKDYIKEPDIPVPEFILADLDVKGIPWSEAVENRPDA